MAFAVFRCDVFSDADEIPATYLSERPNKSIGPYANCLTLVIMKIAWSLQRLNNVLDFDWCMAMHDIFTNSTSMVIWQILSINGVGFRFDEVMAPNH